MKKQWLMLGLLVNAMGVAQAQSAFYGQIGLGAAHAGMSCPGQERCDSGGYAMRGLGGYRFEGAWAAEAGWIVLAGFKHAQQPFEYSMEVRALTLGVAQHGAWGQNGSVVWRAGLASVRSSTDNLVLAPGGNKDTEVQPYVGLDLGYRLNRLISLRAALDVSAARVRYSDGNSEGVRLQTLTLGVGFNF